MSTEFALRCLNSLIYNAIIGTDSILKVLAAMIIDAEGETKRELERALCLKDNIQPSENDNNYKEYNQILKRQIDPQYAAEVKRVLGVLVNELKDGQEHELNENVNKFTNGLIKSIIAEGSITPTTDTLILNTIYFSCKWKVNFEKAGEISFNDVMVPAIRTLSDIGYIQNDACRVIILPFLSHSPMDMCIIVPNIDLDLFKKDTTAQDIETLIKSAESTYLDLYMPAFNLETSLQPEKLLKDVQFHPDVQMQHRALIEVDEHGVVMATSTSLIFFGKADTPPPPIKVTVNTPFLFFMRRNGKVIAAGQVYKLN